MKLASYHGTRDGIMGIGNWAIRVRLRGQMSHSEIVFMPGEGVDHFMPDGTCEPKDGAFWCVSSVGLERVPEWSPYRAGRLGGVRFKRIVLDPAKWTVRPVYGVDVHKAAAWAHKNQGMLYDWQLIASFVSWVIPQKAKRGMCSDVCAQMIGYADSWRFDPCLLDVVTQGPTW